MKHVFVETNWVVDYCAPAHQRASAAVGLLDLARSNKIQLHLPALCLSEANGAIRKRFQPREANALRQYLKWAKANGHLGVNEEQVTRRVLDQFERVVNTDLDNLESRLSALRTEVGLEVFPLSEAMLERSISQVVEKLDLKPFDNSILAAVLVKAEELLRMGHSDLAFCELDGDLRPWDKNGRDKPPLKRLYDSAHVWVYGDFTITTPERPESW
jgi:hypothetical protein